MNDTITNISENNLACELKNNRLVHKFAQDILWLCIDKSLECGKTKQEIIPLLQEAYMPNSQDLKKPGLSKRDSVEVVQCVLKNNKKKYNFILDSKKFYKIMGAFYSWTDRRTDYNREFIKCCIENDPKLRKLLRERIIEMFCLPDSMTWDDIKRMIENDVDSDKIYYSVLIDATNNPRSSIRRNLASVPYIRNSQINNIQVINTVNPKRNKDCHKDVTRNRNARVVLANSYYNISNTFFSHVLETYDRPKMAGPSGSIIVTHDIIFHLLKMKPSKMNKLLLLCCAIADYVPYHHSLSEILMSYTKEINAGYTIDQDPVDFVRALCKNII